jgi:hypothetical protein
VAHRCSQTIDSWQAFVPSLSSRTLDCPYPHGRMPSLMLLGRITSDATAQARTRSLVHHGAVIVQTGAQPAHLVGVALGRVGGELDAYAWDVGHYQ